MIEEKQILINGLKINYKIAGEGNRGAREAGGRREGCSLLILHGWGSSSDSWIEVQKILAGKGYCVICPDLPGFGKTIAPSGTWEVRNYANFILNFIEKLNLGETILLGYSFGGRIAIKFASLWPEKLKLLILCAAAGIKEKLNFYQKTILFFARIGNFLFSPRPLRRFKDFFRNLFYLLFLRKSNHRWVKESMRETFKQIVNEDLTGDLSKIKTKTLIIWGERDQWLFLKTAHLIKEKISQSVLETIPKASHTLHLEFPEKLAEIILNFLKSEKI